MLDITKDIQSLTTFSTPFQRLLETAPKEQASRGAHGERQSRGGGTGCRGL
jgi:hypothetical protein